MSYFDMQFIHRPLVQVKIGGISISLYPMPDALMLAAKRAHGFHVNKNNLLAANLTPRQVLNALGQQTGQGTVVRFPDSYATSTITGIISRISPS